MVSLCITQINMGGAIWYLDAGTTFNLRRRRTPGLCAHTGSQYTALDTPGCFCSLFILGFKGGCANESIVVFHRAIERIYRDHCEQNSKERPECLDSSLSDDLMLTDSAVWAKVREKIGA